MALILGAMLILSPIVFLLLLALFLLMAKEAKGRLLDDQQSRIRKASPYDEYQQYQTLLASLDHRINVISLEYAEYETNPKYLVTHPSIRDVTVSSTARFIEQFAETRRQRDLAVAKGNMAQIHHLAEDVQRLEMFWDLALQDEERIVNFGLSQAQRRRMQRLVDRITCPANEYEQLEDIQALQDILSSISYIDEESRERKLQGEAIMKKSALTLQESHTGELE